MLEPGFEPAVTALEQVGMEAGATPRDGVIVGGSCSATTGAGTRRPRSRPCSGLGTNREPAPLSIVRGATDMPYFPIRE